MTLDFGFGSMPSGQPLADRLAGPIAGQGSGDVTTHLAGQSDLPAVAAATPLLELAVGLARDAAGMPSRQLFDLGDRVRIVAATRQLERAVNRVEADLPRFIERIRLIDEPNVIDMRAAKDAMVVAQLGLRIVKGGRA